jgi:hypothetical protein
MGGFSIGYGIGISPRTAAFDADALAYFATAGITDSTAQIQINDFVKGIKDLGLWSSMVSWPLRSSQNAGTGTTAYSLGGLGTYNGTLTSGPTWSADGISFDGSNDYIETSFNPAFNNVCVYASANTTNRLARRMIYSQKFDGPNQGFELFNEGISSPGPIKSEVYDGGFKSSDAGVATDGQFASVGLFWDKSSITAFRDVSSGSSTPTNSATTLTARIGLNLSGQRPFLGLIAAVVVIHDKGNVFSSVRSLYKTTLGQGLGLP